MIQFSKPKGVKPKMRNNKLRRSVNWLEALKQRHKTNRCKTMVKCNYVIV